MHVAYVTDLGFCVPRRDNPDLGEQRYLSIDCEVTLACATVRSLGG